MNHCLFCGIETENSHCFCRSICLESFIFELPSYERERRISELKLKRSIPSDDTIKTGPVKESHCLSDTKNRHYR
jgi:hypothetical protein